MNSTFKVIFNKARGALMVVNEVTSSVQAKGTKTVVAAAVATMIAGVSGASMAAAPVKSVDIEGTLTVTDATYEPSGTVTATYTTTPAGSAPTDTTGVWNSTNHNLGAASTVVLKGGTLQVNSATGAGADVNVATVKGQGTIGIKALNAAAGIDSKLTFATPGLATNEKDDILVKFDHAGTGDSEGIATLIMSGSADFGHIASKASKNGLVTFEVTKDTSAKIDVTTINLINAKFANNGALTFTGDVNVKQDLDTSADEGKYIAEKALTIANDASYTVKSLYVGPDADPTASKKDQQDAWKAAKTVVVGDVTVGTDSSLVKESGLKADSVTLNGNGKKVTLNAKSVSEIGTLSVFDGDFIMNSKSESDPSTTEEVKSAAKATIGTLNVNGGKVTLNGEATIEKLTAKAGEVKLQGTNTVTTLTVLGGIDNTADKLVQSSGTTSVDNLVIGSAEKAGDALAKFAITGGTFSATDVKIGTGFAADEFIVTSADKLELGTVDVAKDAHLNMTTATDASIDTIKTVKGSKVTLAGTTKVTNLTVASGIDGTASAGAIALKDTVTIDNLTIGSAAKVSTDASTKLTLGKIQAEGTAGTDLGKLALGVGSTLTTDFSNVLSSKIWETVTVQKYLDLSAGLVNFELSGDMNYTLKQYEDVKAGLKATHASAYAHTLKLTEGTFVSETAGQLPTWTEVQTKLDGHDAARSAVQHTASGTTASVTGATVGSVKFIGKDASTLLTDAEISSATLRGDAKGDLVLFGDNVKDDVKVALKDVTLGKAKSDDAGVYLGTVKIDAATEATGLKVAGGSFTLGNVTGAKGIALTSGSLTLLGASYELDKADADEGKYRPLTIGYTFTPAATRAASGTTTAAFSGALTIGDGQFLALGNYEAQAKAKLAALKAANPTEADKMSLVYIGEQTKMAVAPSFATATNNNVYIDLANVAATAGYDNTQGIFVTEAAANLTANTITLDGLNKNVVITDNGATFINLGNLVGNVELGNVFYKDDYLEASDKGLFEVKVNEDEVFEMNYLGFNTAASVEDGIRTFTAPQNLFASTIYNKWGDWNNQCDRLVAEALVASGLLTDGTTVDDLLAQGARLSSFIKAGNEKAVLKLEDQVETQFWNQIVNEENTATNLAVAGGAFNAALDVNDQVTAALDRRTSLANLNAPRTEGFTPWVDVFGTANENEAYEADIYGAVLGFDYTASCGGVFGAAFNVGTADSNSANNATKVDNDSDFYGFSIYGAQTFGDFNVKADFGYTKLKNELSANTAFFGAVSEKLDSDVLTFGVGAEYLVKFGQLNVVPHAGLRVSRLSMDDSQYGASYDDMTVYQMPMGVAFSGTFETNGWQLAPMVDLTVVPAFGDKNAIATYFGGIEQSTRVVDTNPIQVKLGVEAQNGAFTFGVNYGLLAGSDDRMNNSFNANVRYTF